MDCATFLQKLFEYKEEERALEVKAYHKSQREHLGVKMAHGEALCKTAAKSLKGKALISLAQELWATNTFDAMICSAKLLRFPPPSKEIWETIEAFLQDVDGWALEDTMCHAAWKCILADNKLLDTLEGWTKHPNFWMRRAALIYTLPFAKKGQDVERMLGWASLYANDKEWFIQKAIGWWLRTLGDTQPQRVVEFVKKHGMQLKTVAKKEATRKLLPSFKKEALDFLGQSS